jgi:hypothetical protein
MLTLSSSDLLRIWERAATCAPAARPLAVLAEVLPDVAPETLWSWSLGRRDAWLWTVREALFGREGTARVACPCGRDLEVALRTDELRTGLPADATPARCRLDVGGFSIELRRPDSSDLLAAAGCADAAAARECIVRRCIRAARDGSDVSSGMASSGTPSSEAVSSEAVSSETLPADLVAALAPRLAALAESDETLLTAVCPDCHAESRIAIDAAEFVLAEITTAAARLFEDIHCLARGYGWNEAEILALPPLRRRVYLELLAG